MSPTRSFEIGVRPSKQVKFQFFDYSTAVKFLFINRFRQNILSGYRLGRLTWEWLNNAKEASEYRENWRNLWNSRLFKPLGRKSFAYRQISTKVYDLGRPASEWWDDSENGQTTELIDKTCKRITLIDYLRAVKFLFIFDQVSYEGTPLESHLTAVKHWVKLVRHRSKMGKIWKTHYFQYPAAVKF